MTVQEAMRETAGFYRNGEYMDATVSTDDIVYDLIAIGAGTAGLVAAGFAARLGLKVALIEKEQLGGDCTWFGCVPSKALLKAAHVAQTVRTAAQFGIEVDAPRVDMGKVRDYVQGTIRDVAEEENAEAYSKRGVDVFAGTGRFVSENTVEVNGRRLTGKRFVIATGARPSMPPIKGLDSVPYHTYKTIFDLDVLPQRMLIAGAGPIGVEMTQAFARLGSDVTIIDAQMLPRDEPEAAEVMGRILAREGVTFVQGLVASVQMDGEEIVATMPDGSTHRGDVLLVATGRVPNVDSLGLEAAGVVYDTKGVQVDKYLRTNVKHIYAAGDVIGGPQFTHNSNFQGSAVAQNALFPVVNTVGIEDDLMPWVTFTEPEVAHVGLTEAQARERHGDGFKVYFYPMTGSDRGQTEADTEGFIKIVHRNGRMIGVTIVANRAGEMLTEFTMAMKNKLTLRQMIGAIHPYPTYSETVYRAVSYMLVDELFDGVSGRAIEAAKKVLF